MPWGDQQAGVSELAPPDNLLVTVRDFCERYGLTYPPDEPERSRIETELELASSTVRLMSRGRIYTAMSDDDVVLDGSGGRKLFLPARLLPIRDVTSIVDVDQGTDPVDAALYDWSADGIIEWRDCGRTWTSRKRGVTVTCDHGYVTIPRAVEGVVMSLAQRLLDNPGGSQIQSEQVGGYSVQYATGAVGLTELELRTLELAGGGGR